jgi:hypothetical protein
MSVTFAPITHHLPHTYGVTCHAQGEPFTIGARATYAEGREVTVRHMLICEGCRTYGAFTTATPVGHEEAPSPNFSNANAHRVLNLLGYTTEDLCGAAPAAEVLERAEDAIVRLDSPWSPLRGTEDGMPRRLAAVAEVARYAIAHGLGVSWA